MILLVTGPAGAGKTTTCEAFLKQAEGTWAYVNQDDIRQFVKVGYATADGLEADWTKATRLQWESSVPICCDIARRYAEHGIHCLIDFSASPSEFEHWKQYLENLDYSLLVLMPSEETDLQRNHDRAVPGRLTDQKIVENYEHAAAWRSAGVPVLDNSGGDVEQTVAELMQLVGMA